ncbi:hypothetical protein OZY43_03310 [Lactobacillus sp. ESL0785]|uniref:hypothetical protein n=1 Tax=Lactobacillus sp. ESL0785 TaxID=2983232 RepID=UPI0023F627A6|nr:hypothetical protein [Lactobacillus sp. ESL0785]WEV71443.1 hypothetical protein OZY43_03310 [Lactobacillus sp. ESL0785]
MKTEFNTENGPSELDMAVSDKAKENLAKYGLTLADYINVALTHVANDDRQLSEFLEMAKRDMNKPGLDSWLNNVDAD